MPKMFSKSALLGSVCVLAFASAAHAETFNVPAGALDAALQDYMAQSGIQLFVTDDAVRGVRTRGVAGNISAEVALARILEGTGLVAHSESGAIAVVREKHNIEFTHLAQITPIKVAAAAAAGVESVVVTSSKIKGDIQTVPIAITALSQEQLTSRQIAGGPDLVKEVPNLTFSKTNFTGYNIQIRGIGTQAISVTTDPAVAVAFNDTPFIRNHFFEQEFYDLSQAEVLRGPQGTLYGRNATAGVVNLVSAKPTNQFEMMASADIGNYNNRRFESMINIPLVDDWLSFRLAGEWTKRDGYSFNEITGRPIDGRDLWSSRATIAWRPLQELQVYFVWEHFQENDDRLRSSKQLCKTAPGITEIGGVQMQSPNDLSQGCLPTSMYSADAFEVPNGLSLPYFEPFAQDSTPIRAGVDPYASATQSRNLRVIESTLDPIYRAKNDVMEINGDYNVTPELTLTSQTGVNKDYLWATEDFNRYNTQPGVFSYSPSASLQLISPNGQFCDPQLGCTDRLVAQDLSSETAWQFSQEIRLASNFSGPLNFSIGANYMRYVTEENYYVFINSVTLFSANENFNKVGVWNPGVSDNHGCLMNLRAVDTGWFQYRKPGDDSSTLSCKYIDPNPIGSLNNEGHNYFLSENPYKLNSYAIFGEAYLNLTPDFKLTGGLRYTEDKKDFTLIPSWIAVGGYGYPIAGQVLQKWDKLTGRFAADWTPKLDFTDQTLLYASYAHGYKAGGANPPGAQPLGSGVFPPTHPLTFAPEFVDAYEAGTKNTLLDGALTLNGDVFYYDYKGYQISQIVDRTSVNLNFDATVRGSEIEATWEPTPGLKFSFAGGYEDTALAKGSKAIDLIDRTAGTPGWHVVKPAPTQTSNCVLPDYVIKALNGGFENGGGQDGTCHNVYTNHMVIAGFDPSSAPNGGAGFYKDLSNNELPNAPHYTTSLTAEYTLPVLQNWAATLHGDFYWQSQSFARVFNDRPYDKIRGYSNVNLALILTGANGWQAMGYMKNIFDTTAITGAFLNSDDTGLATNVFLTDPRLYGIRLTKNW